MGAAIAGLPLVQRYKPSPRHQGDRNAGLRASNASSTSISSAALLELARSVGFSSPFSSPTARSRKGASANATATTATASATTGTGTGAGTGTTETAASARAGLYELDGGVRTDLFDGDDGIVGVSQRGMTGYQFADSYETQDLCSPTTPGIALANEPLHMPDEHHGPSQRDNGDSVISNKNNSAHGLPVAPSTSAAPEPAE